MTRQGELRAVGRLTGEALAGAVGIIGEVHQAVSQRVIAALPPGPDTIAIAQATAAKAVYAGVAAGYRAVPVVATELMARGTTSAQKLSHTTWGRFAVPALNGLWGDTVAERHPALAVRTAVRVVGDDLPLDVATVAAAFPDATPRIVVFLHGLAESESFWWRRPDDATPSTPADGAVRSYGDRLRAEGFTPVYLRYNSGLRISDNGRDVADLLHQLVAAWPVPVDEIDLIGHSMGGLVARSACRRAELEERSWVRSVRVVVTLGTPHLGAPLEKAVHAAAWLLSRVPEVAPLGRLLHLRSAGVRDLRFGALVPDDWEGDDPEAFLRDTCTDVPFLDQATYYFVAASVTRDPEHPAGRLLGDGLVRYPSAAGLGRTRRIPFELENGTHLGGLHHFSLLNHPEVYALLRTWLSTQAPQQNRPNP